MEIVHKEHEETRRFFFFVVLRVLCGRFFGGKAASAIELLDVTLRER